MPSLDAYSNLQLDDEDGIDVWLLAHRARHQTYAYAASKAGVTIGPYNFDDYPDDNWYAQHTSAHLVLEQFSVPDQTIDMTILQNNTWDNQSDFDAWMQMHTLIHRRIDEYLGIF
jgi:hypothetical protein